MGSDFMKLYNTLTRKIDEFIPNNKDEVTMYTCGPTVYHYAHIGNLRTYIMEDILGEEVQIVNWWKNSKNFIEGLSDGISEKTFNFRLLNGGNIENATSTNIDKNVVNKSNSESYNFKTTLSSQARNHEFVKHGWDSNSILFVRLLLAGDWTELYGITDFGGVGTSGSGVAFKDIEIVAKPPVS